MSGAATTAPGFWPAKGMPSHRRHPVGSLFYVDYEIDNTKRFTGKR
jgi:hypothetical protein